MTNKEVLVSFIRKHFSLFITDPEKVAEDFLNANIDTPIVSMYSEGQQAKVKKRIESGEHVVKVGDIFTKVGNMYKMPIKTKEVDGQNITTYIDIPRKDVEGNAEHFTFANAEGVFLDHENIVKLVPTPALK